MSAPAPSKKEFLTRDDSGLHARLETDRLIIRSLEDGDFLHLYSLRSDKEVMKYVGAGGVRAEERVRKEFEFYRKLWREGDPISAYAVFSKNSEGLEDKFIGIQALEKIDEKKGDASVAAGSAEWMLWLAQDFWGKGYGFEMGNGLIRLIAELDKCRTPILVGGAPLTKLIATATPENEGSIKLQEKLGFSHVDDRECEYSGGRKVVKRFFELDLSKILASPSPNVGEAKVVEGEKSSDLGRV